MGAARALAQVKCVVWMWMYVEAAVGAHFCVCAACLS